MCVINELRRLHRGHAALPLWELTGPGLHCPAPATACRIGAMSPSPCSGSPELARPRRHRLWPYSAHGSLPGSADRSPHAVLRPASRW
jgi:hypothetical protein